MAVGGRSRELSRQPAADIRTEVNIRIFQKLAHIKAHAVPQCADHAFGIDIVAVLKCRDCQQVNILRKSRQIMAPYLDQFLLALHLEGVLIERQLSGAHAPVQLLLCVFQRDAAHVAEMGSFYNGCLANGTFFHDGPRLVIS